MQFLRNFLLFLILVPLSGTATELSAVPLDASKKATYSSLLSSSGGLGLTESVYAAKLHDPLAEAKRIFSGVGVKIHKERRSKALFDGKLDLYTFSFGKIPLEECSIRVHTASGRPELVQIDLPNTPIRAIAQNFLALDEIYRPGRKKIQSAHRIYLCENDSVVPAWKILVGRDLDTAMVMVINAQDGTVLREQPISFHNITADVFVDNTYESLETKDLLYHNGGEELDGQYFSVYGVGIDTERAVTDSGHYVFDPADEEDFFDQIQTYYNAEQAVSWFLSLGHKFSGLPFAIFTRANLENNARYIPPTDNAPAMIRLGAPDGIMMQNLARDGDVITHEIGHHVINDYITSKSDEAFVLHEGLADFFTFAMTGNPNLAESVMVNAPFLRSVYDLPGIGLDDPRNPPDNPHVAGLYLASFLWDILTETGDDFAKIAYSSLSYLPADSADLSDVVLGLLHATQNFYASDLDKQEQTKCLILVRGIARGFAPYLPDVDTSACDVDIEQQVSLRKQEIQVLKQEGEPKPKGRPLVSCAVIANDRQQSDLPFALWLFAVPMLLCCAMFLNRRSSGKMVEERHE
ncbi:MAG: hypothetical protein AB7T49_11615 [Oligoflexales bacterium]